MRTSHSALVLSFGLTLLAVPLPTHAADWLATNFSMNYDNGRGVAQADAAQFTIEGQVYNFSNASFDVSWGADHLVIERPADSFRYEIAAPFMKDVKSAQVEGLSFKAVPGQISFAVGSAKLQQVKSDTELDKTTLSCQSAAGAPDPVDACVEYLRLKSDGVDAGDTKIKEASLSVTKGKLTFAVNLSGVGKINGEGTASHDAANKTVVLKISKVKYGIIEVTGQFFSQLKNVKSDMIKVDRPYVYVNYGKKDPAPLH